MVGVETISIKIKKNTEQSFFLFIFEFWLAYVSFCSLIKEGIYEKEMLVISFWGFGILEK